MRRLLLPCCSSPSRRVMAGRCGALALCRRLVVASSPTEGSTSATQDKKAGTVTPAATTTTTLQHAAEHVERPTAAVAASAAQVGKTDVAAVPAEGRLAPPPPPRRAPIPFFFKGRRGSSSPEYYVSPGMPGYVDPVAELLDAGRTDSEYMWLKFLAYICAGSTIGLAVYGFFFEDQVKWFKDEPWSPFRN